MSTLIEALEAEHRVIDDGIEAFAQAVADGSADLATLQQTFGLLRRHIYAEEEFLFPPLKEAGLVMPILVMLREHGEMWQRMQALEELAGTGENPGGVTEACSELLALLEQHNTKEEPIIYPQADVTLSPELSDQIEEFLKAGEMPAGWVCEKA
jgi:regulator of cell morphogenesis and NO signaling